MQKGELGFGGNRKDEIMSFRFFKKIKSMLLVQPIDIIIGEKDCLEFQLKGVDGNGIGGRNVKVEDEEGIIYNIETDDEGHGKIYLKRTEYNGKLLLKFGGDYKYCGCAESVDVKVNPMVFAMDSRIGEDENYKYKIFVCDVAGKPLSGVEVRFEIEKNEFKKYSFMGWCDFDVKLLKGAYPVKISVGNIVLNRNIFVDENCEKVVLEGFDLLKSTNDDVGMEFRIISRERTIPAELSIHVGDDDFLRYSNSKGIVKFDVDDFEIGEHIVCAEFDKEGYSSVYGIFRLIVSDMVGVSVRSICNDFIEVK